MALFAALALDVGLGFNVGLVAVAAETGAAGFAARTGTVLILGSGAKESAKSGTIESRSAVRGRIGE